jgi:hypothetical protein
MSVLKGLINREMCSAACGIWRLFCANSVINHMPLCKLHVDLMKTMCLLPVRESISNIGFKGNKHLYVINAG